MFVNAPYGTCHWQHVYMADRTSPSVMCMHVWRQPMHAVRADAKCICTLSSTNAKMTDFLYFLTDLMSWHTSAFVNALYGMSLHLSLTDSNRPYLLISLWSQQRCRLNEIPEFAAFVSRKTKTLRRHQNFIMTYVFSIQKQHNWHVHHYTL
jgi:hypothetical protein